MTRIAIVVVAVAAFAMAAPAQAASPPGGTITKTHRSVTWSGSAFVLSEPAPDPVIGVYDPSCHTDSMCDHFALKLVLGEGAKVRISITTARPNPPGSPVPVLGLSLQPLTGDDYDLYVYDPSGRLVSGTAGSTEKGDETVTITHHKRFDGKAYDVAVRAWAVAPGSTYMGAARVLTLGR